MSAILCKDRWDETCSRKWKIGAWSNYGIDASGQSNICAQHMYFLAWADKKPSYKEIHAAFPDLASQCVTSRLGTKKFKNSDIVIIQEGHIYFKYF